MALHRPTRWHSACKKAHQVYCASQHEEFRQNAYSSAPSRAPSCEPSHYQKRCIRHPKYESCGLRLQMKVSEWKSKLRHLYYSSTPANPNFLSTYVTNVHAPSVPQLKLPCSRRIARHFSFPPWVRIKWIRLGPGLRHNVGFPHFHKIAPTAANLQWKCEMLEFLPNLVLAIGRHNSNFRFFFLCSYVYHRYAGACGASLDRYPWMTSPKHPQVTLATASANTKTNM